MKYGFTIRSESEIYSVNGLGLLVCPKKRLEAPKMVAVLEMGRYAGTAEGFHLSTTPPKINAREIGQAV